LGSSFVCARVALATHNYSFIQTRSLGCASMGRLLVSCLAVYSIVGVFGTRVDPASVLDLSVDSNTTSPENESPPPTDHCPRAFKGSCHSETKFQWKDAEVTIPAGKCYKCNFYASYNAGDHTSLLREEGCFDGAFDDSTWLHGVGKRAKFTTARACCELQPCTMQYSAEDAPAELPDIYSAGAICCQKKDNLLVRSFLPKSKVGWVRTCPQGYEKTSNLHCPWSWPAAVKPASICCSNLHATPEWRFPSWDSWWNKHNPCPDYPIHLPHKQCLELSVVDANKDVPTQYDRQAGESMERDTYENGWHQPWNSLLG